MARYQIRQKYFALNDSFDITDSSGAARYTCRSKMISIPKKFWIETASGKPLYFVRKKMIHWLGYPVFKIYKGENKKEGLLATVKVAYSFIGKKIKVKSETFGDYVITGRIGSNWSFFLHEGDKNGEIVATIEKHIFKIADTYDIDVIAAKDSFVVALAVILDFLYHKKH
ncbi:MAG: LURP-one-related family protein [Clostridia bacterium]|nr:LURP-one-related family protein [Clostridia bacterium]